MKHVYGLAVALVALACSSEGQNENTDGVGATGGSTETNVSGSGGSAALGSGGAGELGTGGTMPQSGGAGPASGGAGIGGAGTGGGAMTGTNGVGIAIGPIVEDPLSVAADLPKYYISATGDDSQSGGSPDEAWATLAPIPPDTPSAVFFERGGTYETEPSPPAMGRNGPAAVRVAPGSVWTAYGEGEVRPILFAKSQNPDPERLTGAVIEPGGNTLLDGLNFMGEANFAVLVETDGNVIQNCEVDGRIAGIGGPAPEIEVGGRIQVGFSVRGDNNLIVGNSVHHIHAVIGDTGDYNTSGGAEAFIINGSNVEVAYNTVIDCWTPNETLNGAEGGCTEIIARAPGEVVENVSFHHNYCERTVGLFEGCAGNFLGTAEKIQLNHAVVRNTYLAYNVVVDAMWLYLLQTVNTDFEGLVFEHNTIVHGPANDDIPQGGAGAFGIFFTEDPAFPRQQCSSDAECPDGTRCYERRQGEGQLCIYEGYPQPGQITVRNNLFVVLEGGGQGVMELPPGPNDFYNNIFSPSAPFGVSAERAGTVVPNAELIDSFRIGPNSPAVDTGSTDRQPWIDYDGSSVPCGNGPDVGAIEYCP